MTTTTSSIAFIYKDGIIIGADTQVTKNNSYFHHNMNRIYVYDDFIVTFSGDVADFLSVKEFIDKTIEEEIRKLDTETIISIIQRYIYNKRSKGKPLKCSVIIGGKSNTSNTDSKFILSAVNSKGSFYSDTSIATGIAGHVVLPSIRAVNTLEMNREEAIDFIRTCLRTSVYSDKTCSNSVQIVLFEDENKLCLNEQIATKWSFNNNEIKL
ncbi:PSB7 [Hepatospora eriocheir]|uniref:Proteasome subunit beta n=1 Tax=Hepatospora eriocheir TaxID=1081669 RepID=A0A1X0QKZ9_9MICR|nr:PSB7 [Hepatospora eriocheir]